MDTQTDKPAVLVVEIPAGLSAGDIQELINAQLQDDSYYFSGVIPYAPGALAFLRLRVEKKSQLDKTLPDEDAALAVLKANPRLSCAKMTALLAAKGLKRGSQWVLTKRAELELKAA